MISLRVIWYDYYLWEIVILGLFYLLSNKNIFPAETKSPGKKLNYIIPVTLLLFNIIYRTTDEIKIKKNSRVLDAGCGTGNLLYILERKNTIYKTSD